METSSIHAVRANTNSVNAQTTVTDPANTPPTNAAPANLPAANTRIHARMDEADLAPDQPGDIFYISMPMTRNQNPAWRLPDYNEVLLAAQNQLLTSKRDGQRTSGGNTRLLLMRVRS